MRRPIGDRLTVGLIVIACDPEGYFLEFDTFLEHELNERLMKALGK